MRAREERIEAAYESGVWDAVRDQVPLRHPSQLYEAFAEGVLLGLILWGIFALARRRGLRLPDGTYGGVFLLGYGAFRSVIELFRQPDAQFRGPGDPLGTVLGPLTMGQTLSALMILAGLLLLAGAWRRHLQATRLRPSRDNASVDRVRVPGSRAGTGRTGLSHDVSHSEDPSARPRARPRALGRDDDGARLVHRRATPSGRRAARDPRG